MAWTAALIEAPTQSRKTKKAFDVLANKLNGVRGDILGLFVTQANSTMSAMQILNRITHDEDLLEIFPKENIIRSKEFKKEFDGNLMIIDFWNTRNTEKMLTVVKENKWDRIIIVIDECDSNSVSGIYNRLSFIQEVEKNSKSKLNVIFITATISNFSDSVFKIYIEDHDKFKDSIVEKIITEKCIEKHHAKPHPSYVGTSWYKNTPDVWKELIIPANETKDKENYEKIIMNSICKELNTLPEVNKQLTFVVTSKIRANHAKLAKRMFRIGFNVTIELNSTNNKNYTVMYNSICGEIKEWKIPYNAIEKLAEAGEMKIYTLFEENEDIDSNIEGSEDITLSHVLQASLRMGTNLHKDIIKNVSQDEKIKLLTIYSKIKNLTGDLKRPDDYPKDPKIGMICGNLASRGNSIQNAFIGFTFTSSLYYNNGKSPQRGALNTQMMGRSNGTLLESYTSITGVKPIMISTKTIMRDSLANEAIVLEKAKEIANGELISLKDLVTEVEWKKALKIADDKFEVPNNGKINEIELQHDILRLFITLNKESLTPKEIKNSGIPIDSRQRWSLTNLRDKGYVINPERGIWKITENGIKYINDV
jgi:hypothetical protein